MSNCECARAIKCKTGNKNMLMLVEKRNKRRELKIGRFNFLSLSHSLLHNFFPNMCTSVGGADGRQTKLRDVVPYVVENTPNFKSAGKSVNYLMNVL